MMLMPQNADVAKVFGAMTLRETLTSSGTSASQHHRGNVANHEQIIKLDLVSNPML